MQDNLIRPLYFRLSLKDQRDQKKDLVILVTTSRRELFRQVSGDERRIKGLIEIFYVVSVHKHFITGGEAISY